MPTCSLGPPGGFARGAAARRRVSFSGTFLAAQHATRERDAAAAATFYRSALRADPRNNELLDRPFLSVLLNGDVEEAVRLAGQVLKVDKEAPLARLVLGARALKHTQYQ